MTIENIDTGPGFSLFCEEGEGKTDIVNASRLIKDEEIETCAKISRTPIPFLVGTDALVVAVNPTNQFVSDATLEELAKIFTAKRWSDVNPDWPAKEIVRFVPDTGSGTFDFFVTKVFNSDETDVTLFLNTPNTQFSANPTEQVLGIATDKNGIGFFGFAYYQQNEGLMKVVKIESVEPSAETAESGKYALSRPLLMYSDAGIIQQKPQVGSFISFYLTHVNAIIEDIGYFPLSASQLDEAKLNLKEAMEGKN